MMTAMVITLERVEKLDAAADAVVCCMTIERTYCLALVLQNLALSTFWVRTCRPHKVRAYRPHLYCPSEIMAPRSPSVLEIVLVVEPTTPVGGSWALVTRFISTLIGVISIVTLLIALVTKSNDPSKYP